MIFRLKDVPIIFNEFPEQGDFIELSGGEYLVTGVTVMEKASGKKKVTLQLEKEREPVIHSKLGNTEELEQEVEQIFDEEEEENGLLDEERVYG